MVALRNQHSCCDAAKQSCDQRSYSTQYLQRAFVKISKQFRNWSTPTRELQVSVAWFLHQQSAKHRVQLANTLLVESSQTLRWSILRCCLIPCFRTARTGFANSPCDEVDGEAILRVGRSIIYHVGQLRQI